MPRDLADFITDARVTVPRHIGLSFLELLDSIQLGPKASMEPTRSNWQDKPNLGKQIRSSCPNKSDLDGWIRSSCSDN